MTSIFITGGAGFVGSAFVRALLTRDDYERITIYDSFTYVASDRNVPDDPRIQVIRNDITNRRVLQHSMRGHQVVVHFAAETHVDRSITGSNDFITTNCVGTNLVCEAARLWEVDLFLHISTDEVYGSIDFGTYSETDLLDPSSPYSASKASSELIALAHRTTFGLPVIVSRSANQFGPRQYPDKLIPLFASRLLAGETVPLYGDGMQVRDWLYVDDNVEALLLLLERGELGEVYNIGGDNERTNIEIAELLCALTDADPSLIRPVEDRLGHDRRYAINSTKIRDLGWAGPRRPFLDQLGDTVAWYRDHGTSWWDA